MCILKPCGCTSVMFVKAFSFRGQYRLYTDDDLERLELILNLTRELVSTCWVEIILNMRARMEDMQKEIRQFMEFIQTELSGHILGLKLALKMH